ncbi:MAG: undecaprenyl-diphosphate phosphatase [Spirochaetes bacterium]|nr:undecaprenyl-diphosphate phosphatase [Spirochaetota bacterium]
MELTLPALLTAAILGLVQGLTEFLPVSSSTHLRFLHALFSFDAGASSVAFDVTLHAGTLCAVVIVLWRPQIIQKTPALRTVCMLAVSLASTVIVYIILKKAGITMKDSAVGADEHAVLIMFAAGLLVTGVLLIATRFIKNNTRDALSLGLVFAVVVGSAQGLALLPGISRSGITIISSLFLGAAPGFAGTYSFLLSIPAILGAAAMDIRHIAALDPLVLAVGFICAFISGFAALKLLITLIKKGRFYFFGFYCIAAGITALVVLLR